jgi:DNA-binding MarR family transcriptional regulator
MADSSDMFMRSLHRWWEAFMHRSMYHVLAYSRRRSLSLSHLGTMLRIHHAGSCGIGEITDMLGVSSAGASQMVDRLVQHGLVRRMEDRHDRRAKRLELTDRGHRTVHRMVEARHRWLRLLSDQLSDEERADASRVLDMLTARLEAVERMNK